LSAVHAKPSVGYLQQNANIESTFRSQGRSKAVTGVMTNQPNGESKVHVASLPRLSRRVHNIYTSRLSSDWHVVYIGPLLYVRVTTTLF